MKDDAPNPDYKEIMEYDYSIKPLPKQDDYEKLKKAYEYLLSRYSENFIILNELTLKHQLLYAKYKHDTNAIKLLQGSNILSESSLFKENVSDATREEVLNILTTLKSTYEEYNTKLTELLTDNTKSAEEKRIEYLLKFLIQLS
jgi:hypothetical protein